MARKAQQLSLVLNTWGGHREGAGRPRTKGEGAHVARPELQARFPVHVTLRIRKGLPTLRQKRVFNFFARAVMKARLNGLRVLEFSLLGNHIHMLIEADGEKTLSKGMQSFGISMGRNLRSVAHQAGGAAQGSVFEKRYHMHILKSPSEVRRALSYVLLNESKHRKATPSLDRYSSAISFSRWQELFRQKPPWDADPPSWLISYSEDMDRLKSAPQTWLVRTGWCAGLKARAPSTSSISVSD